MTNVEKDTQLEEVHQPTVQKIATEIIEPALRKALAEARKDGSAQEVVNALANCYGGLLVDLMGLRSFSNDIFDLAMMAMFTWELISGSNIASNVGYFLWGCFVSGCCIRFYNLPILKDKNNS